MRRAKNIVSFTPSAVRSAGPIDGKRTEYRLIDGTTLMTNLILEAHPTGKKAWRVLFRDRATDKYRRKTIGNSQSSLPAIRKAWIDFVRPDRPGAKETLMEMAAAVHTGKTLKRLAHRAEPPETILEAKTSKNDVKAIADKYIPRRP